MGCATAHNVAIAGLDELAAELDDPSHAAALQRGSRLGRTELLDQVVAELAPVAVGGSLGS